MRARHVVAHVVRTEVISDAEAVFDDAAGAGETFGQFATPEIVSIDDQTRTRCVGGDLEELHLRLEILLHRAVVVEMVLREVREDGGGKRQAMSAMLIERVGGDLHGAGTAAIAAHLGEQALNLQRLRRGVRGRHLLAAEIIKNGAKQSAAHLAEVHQMMREEGGGRFAIRAGDADERHVFRRMAVQGRGGIGERNARVTHMNPRRGAAIWRSLFRDDGSATGLDGLRNEGVAVHAAAAQRHEGDAGACFA